MNVRTMQWFGTWIVIACSFLMAQPAHAVHPWEQWADEMGLDLEVSYDGTRIMTMKHGEFEIAEHKAPQKMYTEFNMGNMSGAFILREDLNKSYTLMPSMGMYREMSLDEGMYEAAGGMEFSQIEEVGKEVVNGHPSTKFKARFEDKQGKGAGFMWITDTGVPIKMDMIYSSDEVKGMRISSELVELNIRPQDPAVFGLPEGLKPMSFSGMSGLSGLMKSGGGEGGGSAATPGLGGIMDALSPEQKEALSGAGLGGLIPGAGDQGNQGGQQPQAAPAGSGAAVQADSMSSQLTTDDLTQSVQLHLQYLGIDPGNTSGELSIDTQIAISEFQASKGMKVTGEVSPQLLGALSAEVDSE